MGCASSLESAFEDDSPPQGEDMFFSFHYTLGRKLGRGSSCMVYAAEAVSPTNRGHEYAVKVIILTHNSRMLDEKHVLKSARKEAVLWQLVGNHNHCVQLLHIFYEITGRYMMVMERCTCSLSEMLLQSRDIGEAWLLRTFREMLLGIAHVHKVGIVHRDIKPDNFLLGGADRQTIKLTDFGAAAKLPKRRQLKGLFGTVQYCSPEMLSGSAYDASTDMWSFAACAYMILTGDYVYSPPGEQTSSAVKRAILAGAPEPTFIWAHWLSAPPTRAGQFVRSLLERDPQVRRTAEEALQMPLLVGGPVVSSGGDGSPAVRSGSHPVSQSSQNRGAPPGSQNRAPSVASARSVNSRELSILPGQIEELT